MNSLEQILALKPSVIYPGHGPVVSTPERHLKMYINHRNAREKQILNCLRGSLSGPLTGMQIVKIVYHVSSEIDNTSIQ